MSYFKDTFGVLHFLSAEDISRGGNEYLPLGCVSITDIEAASILAPTLAQVQSAKMVELQNARDAATVADVVVNGVTLSAQPHIQTGMKRLGDRVRRGKPTTLAAVLDVNDNPVAVNQTLLDAYEDAVASNTEAAWNHYGQLVQQVKAATTVAQVQAIVW